MPLTIHRLTNGAQLQQASQDLANCLDTYRPESIQGHRRIILVRLDGAPLYAIEIQHGRIVQFKGRGNRSPEPEHVPIVRRLLAEAGHVTSQPWAAAPRPPGPVAAVPAAQAAPPQRAPARPARPARPPRPARRPRPAPPATLLPRPDPWASLHAMAQDLLRPGDGADAAGLDRVDWTELATALWLDGLLVDLPDPVEDADVELLVRDLAGVVLRGAEGELDRGDPPGPELVRRTMDALLATPREQVGGWQRRRMADLLRRVNGRQREGERRAT